MQILIGNNIDVCVVTGPHLREKGLGRVEFERYAGLRKHCRATEGQIGGRVLILVRNAVAAKEEDSPFRPRSRKEACAIAAFFTDRPENKNGFTGVYIPPKKTKLVTIQKCLKT